MLILVLFVSFRLMVLVSFSPGGFLTNYTDHFHYYSIAQLTVDGYYPLVNLWYEYPPLHAYLSLAIYLIANAVHQGFLHYTLSLAVFMLPFESGNLVLLYLIARDLWGTNISLRIAWIYSCLLIPVFFWMGCLELLVVFFCLLSIHMFLKGRHFLGAVALGLGALTKYVPLLLLAAMWRFSPNRTIRAKYLLVASTVVIIGFLPFLLVSPSYTLGSLRILADRPPWETLWALVEGNFDIGGLGPVENRMDLTGGPGGEVGTYRPLWILATLALGLLCLHVLLRKRILVSDKRGLVILSAMMVCVFFLWSKGWSPGWLVLLIPFVLLVFPAWRGVLYCLTLSFVNLLEWPIFFVAAPHRKEIFALIVVVRALVFALLLANLYQELGKEVSVAQQR